MDIDGSIALVTGGASGLGEATARRLSAAGARCVLVDRNEERGATVAQEIGAELVVADVTDPDALGDAVEFAARLGPLRVGVACAGVGPAARIVGKTGEAVDLEWFAKTVNVNLVGTFNALRLCAATMVRTEALEDGARGVFVMTASIAAYDGQIGQAAYAASKGGVVGLTLPAARDLASHGIRVNTIAPGLFDTPLLEGLRADVREALAAGVPFPKRLGDPAEYAETVAHVIANGYLNGETIRLDGSLRMAPR